MGRSRMRRNLLWLIRMRPNRLIPVLCKNHRKRAWDRSLRARCPNGPSWFIFALLPSWLLYPLSRNMVQYAEDRGEGHGLLALAAAAFLVSFGPGLFLLLVNGNITMQQHNDMMFWPPSQLADFLLGMTTAALVRRYKGTRLKGLADLSMLLVLLVVFLLPRPPQTYEMHLNGWEPLLDHGLAPLLAAFILGSCVEEDPGWSGRLLAHPALVSLGDLSFQVYIFQRPMHDTIGLLLSTEEMDVFMAYMVSLWLFAGIYKVFVEDLVDARIKLWAPRSEPQAVPREQEYGLLSRSSAPERA
ncbi:unnamed protein product [Cladocopium goreaui]|uniref:Acyltransferase 3 domain-containing protein n=1 Tax=Cladocopium goreaui TaxID=2562237 RepID=A0A9P1D985_9DINO|nr:unnamed protein product [Cladocopium goreaui]